MRIGVDVDDVLFPWYEKAHAACVAAGITSGVDPSTWSPHEEYGTTLEAWRDVLAAVTLDGTLYSGDPYPGAVDALHTLADYGHTLHLVTARGFMAHGDLIREQTVQWLALHEVPHDTLTFAKDKTLVRVDVFADDSERNITQLVAASIPAYLIDAPHNQHVTTAPRFATFAAFANYVIERNITA